MKFTKDYYSVEMNDGGFPVIQQHDSVDDARKNIHPYSQHWMIVRVKDGKKMMSNDDPASE